MGKCSSCLFFTSDWLAAVEEEEEEDDDCRSLADDGGGGVHQVEEELPSAPRCHKCVKSAMIHAEAPPPPSLSRVANHST